MPNWIVLTADDLNDAKVAAQVDAYRTAALASGQTDVAPRAIQTVVDRIRRKIGSHPSNGVDANPAAIPRGLRDMAVAMILAEMGNRLSFDLTDYEKSQLATFNADLNRIANGQEKVDAPDNPIAAPVEGAPMIETVRHGNHGNDRESLRGL